MVSLTLKKEHIEHVSSLQLCVKKKKQQLMPNNEWQKKCTLFSDAQDFDIAKWYKSEGSSFYASTNCCLIGYNL